MQIRPLAWALGAVLLGFSIYRVTKFQPEPLDGPHTLRPWLLGAYNCILRWYRHPERAESDWLILCCVALLTPAALALWNCCSVRGIVRTRGIAARIACSRVALFAGVAIGLLLCRFPLLLKEASNPDESQFLAAAHKLFFDPVFFRSLDCGTTGPFNVYPLMLPALVGVSPDYASGRLLAILLIFLSLYFLYRAIAQAGPDYVARLAILPAFGFFSVVAYPDFVHNSSEHVSLPLISLALFAGLRCVRDPRRHALPLIGLGALAATAYFAKQQSVPIVAAAAAVAMACVYVNREARRWWRPIALLAAGFAPLPLLNAWICAATGTWHDFVTVYVFGNIRYAQTSQKFLDELPRFAALLPSTRESRFLVVAFLVACAVAAYAVVRRPTQNRFRLLLEIGAVSAAVVAVSSRIVSTSGLSAGWPCVAVFFATAAAVAFLVTEAFGGDRERFWLGLMSAAVLAASVFSMYIAHRMFTHYLLLMVIPLCATMGWMLLRQLSSAERSRLPGAQAAGPAARLPGLPFVILFLALFAGYSLCLRRNAMANFESYHPETMVSPEARFIQSLTRPGPTLAIWGWHHDLYVRAGRPPALRDSSIGNELVSQAAGEYYRRRYLTDMRRHRPDMFVDALKVSCCWVDNPGNRFELVPAIKSYIDSNYIQVADRWDLRFFLRRDLAGVGSSGGCSADAIRCYQSTAGGPAPLPPVQMPPHARIDAEFVPLSPQEDSALVFGSAAPVGAPRGFQFQYAGAGRYRLLVGAGGRWVASRDLDLPERQKVSLSLEFHGKAVAIFCNGKKREDMQLPGGMSGAPDPIALGSGTGGRGFLGAIVSFQIRDLGARPVRGGR
ncbi:MAG TPA: hypothetical protein VKF41_00480 [Bryobacteraceae bacterium]|nr:hypothetical protein [Bryobacteraceae bacterium]